MNKIKFAIVGCGNIGKRHAEIITHHPHAELTALIDTLPFSDLNISQYNIPFFSSLEDFLQSGVAADIVVIATPNGLHTTHAIACLTARKHVLIEKPMALHTADAHNIINTAKKCNAHVFVVMQNRYSRQLAWLKEIIEKNILGNIYSAQLNCFWNRDERYYKNDWHGKKEMDGGVLFTQFSHFIDLFYWLFGDMKNVHAVMRSFNHTNITEFEDSGIVTFEFGKDSLGCLNFSTAVWDKNFESSFIIVAEKGTIKISGQYMDTVEYCHVKDYSLPEFLLSKDTTSNHAHIIQNVIDVLNGKAEITATANDGLQVIGLIEKMYKAALH